MKKRWSKKIWLPLVGLLLLSGGWYFYQSWHHPDKDLLELHGNVDIRQVNLGFRVSGRIQEMRREEGDEVHEGDLIAVLDSGPYQAQVDFAKAQLAQQVANLTKLQNGNRAEEIARSRAQVELAKANLENAEGALKRQVDLARTSVISKQDYDNATMNRDVNKAQLNSAQANLDLENAGWRVEDIAAASAQVDNARANLQNAQLNLSDCQLVAPTNGYIITRALEPGAIVAPGTTVYSMCLYSPVWIRTYIDERDLGRIYPGMKALVYTDTNSNQPYEGQIGFISPIAEFTPKTVQTRELRTDLVFRLRVIIQNPDRYLRQGMPVTIKLLETNADQPGKIEGEPLVRICGLTKRFAPTGGAALEQMDAEVRAGAVTGLVGPDGAGKTTLIRILAGLLEPTAGAVRVLGYDPVKEAEEIHLRIGYMPQRFGLYEDLNVRQNLELYADLRGVLGEERERTFERLLSFTDLKRFTERKAGLLSGGMKQKLGLACALISEPELLLLDEPGVGVDPISRRELWRMVQELVGENIGVLWSTAYLDEAELCHSVILLNEGKKLFDGPPKELTRRVGSRTFALAVTEGRRKVLSRALQLESVMDGVIQGQSVRLLLRSEAAQPTSEQLGLDVRVALKPVPARLEDAFVDILGGVPKGESLVFGQVKTIASEGDVAIKAEALTKRFGDFVATDQITFSVQRSEIFGLLGPNGAGKSTTFKMLCGLLKPSDGKASVGGFDLQRSGSKARNRIGYMAQKFSLYGDLSVQHNLEFFAGIYGLDRTRRRQAREQMIELFSLQQYLNVASGQLPLGFKQRLAMACSLMHQPDVLFLDEPTSGVDPITRREFWSHINGLVEKGVTVLVTTHFMDEAEYCDRIGLVYRGKAHRPGTS
jgi:ABC-2 type transport system ATP-binding protein